MTRIAGPAGELTEPSSRIARTGAQPKTVPTETKERAGEA